MAEYIDYTAPEYQSRGAYSGALGGSGTTPSQPVPRTTTSTPTSSNNAFNTVEIPGAAPVVTKPYVAPVSNTPISSQPVANPTDYKVIGVAPSRGEVLVRAPSGETYWKPGTESQIKEASSVMANGETAYNKQYIPPSGITQEKPTIGSIASSPMKDLQQRWQNKISAQNTISDKYFAGYQADYQKTMLEPTYVYNYRGQKIPVVTGALIDASKLAPNEQLRKMTSFGIIEPGSILVNSTSGNGMNILSGTAIRRQQERMSAEIKLRQAGVFTKDGVILEDALSKGVNESTLRTYGFSQNDINTAKENTTLATRDMSVDEFGVYYSREHGIKNPNSLIKEDIASLHEQNAAINEINAAYITKYGKDKWNQDIKANLPQRSLAVASIMFAPATTLMSLGAVGAAGTALSTGTKVVSSAPSIVSTLGKVGIYGITAAAPLIKTGQPGGYNLQALDYLQIGIGATGVALNAKSLIGGFKPYLTSPQYGKPITISGSPSELSFKNVGGGTTTITGTDQMNLNTMIRQGQLRFKFDSPLVSAIKKGIDSTRGEPYSAFIKNKDTGLYNFGMKRPSFLETLWKSEKGSLGIQTVTPVVVESDITLATTGANINTPSYNPFIIPGNLQQGEHLYVPTTPISYNITPSKIYTPEIIKEVSKSPVKEVIKSPEKRRNPDYDIYPVINPGTQKTPDFKYITPTIPRITPAPITTPVIFPKPVIAPTLVKFPQPPKPPEPPKPPKPPEPFKPKVPLLMIRGKFEGFGGSGSGVGNRDNIQYIKETMETPELAVFMPKDWDNYNPDKLIPPRLRRKKVSQNTSEAVSGYEETQTRFGTRSVKTVRPSKTVTSGMSRNTQGVNISRSYRGRKLPGTNPGVAL